jgi:hypothetical protein
VAFRDEVIRGMRDAPELVQHESRHRRVLVLVLPGQLPQLERIL